MTSVGEERQTGLPFDICGLRNGPRGAALTMVTVMPLLGAELVGPPITQGQQG